MIKTAEISKSLICALSIIFVMGMAVGCSKPLFPPEMEAGADSSGGAGGSGDERFTDMGGLEGQGGGADFRDGFSEESITESGAGLGTGSGSGDSSTFDEFKGQVSGDQEAGLIPFQSTQHLKDIYFDYDRYALDPNTKDILQKNAEWLKKNPDTKVEIQGHCDERGTNNYNLGLGERRSLAVKKYLAALGIEEDRLFTISYGEEKPFCFSSTKECWRSNRRGHFMISR